MGVRPLVQAPLPHTLLSSSVSSAQSHHAILTSPLRILSLPMRGSYCVHTCMRDTAVGHGRRLLPHSAFTLSNRPGPASSSRISLCQLLLLLLPACLGWGNEVQGEPGWPGTCCVHQARLRFGAALLPLPPIFRDPRCEPLHLDLVGFF